MKLLIIFFFLIPSLSWSDFTNFKKYVDSLNDPIEKSVTCMRFWDILSASTEIKIYDLYNSNQKNKAENLLSSFYEMKRRAIFISFLADEYNYNDIVDISYDLGANTDYDAKNVRAFNEPLCVNEINLLMKNKVDLTRKANGEAENYINEFLNKFY